MDTLPGAHVGHILVVTDASEIDPGSQTTFLHWKFVPNQAINNT